MESIGKLLKQQDQLTRKSPDGKTTKLSLREPSDPLQWTEVLKRMAMDKRHDLAPGILSYWKVKLKNYSDIEIVNALLSSCWSFFPSVDNVITVIEANRGSAAVQKADAEWSEWKARQKYAE